MCPALFLGIYTHLIWFSQKLPRGQFLLTSAFDTQVRDSKLPEISHLERGRTEPRNHLSLTHPALNHHPVLRSAPDAARMGMPSSGLGSGYKVMWLPPTTSSSKVNNWAWNTDSQLANKVAFLSLVMWAGRSCHHWSSFHPPLHFAEEDPNT